MSKKQTSLTEEQTCRNAALQQSGQAPSRNADAGTRHYGDCGNYDNTSNECNVCNDCAQKSAPIRAQHVTSGEVAAARDALMKQNGGRYTREEIRRAIGHGSYTTIGRFLNELEAADSEKARSREEIAVTDEELFNMARKLILRALSLREADSRARVMAANASAQALQEKYSAQLTAYEQKIDVLESELAVRAASEKAMALKIAGLTTRCSELTAELCRERAVNQGLRDVRSLVEEIIAGNGGGNRT